MSGACPLCVAWGETGASGPRLQAIAPPRPPHEGPGAWRPLRTFCVDHARRARLGDGRTLAEVLAVPTAALVEGPGLGCVLNPVTVEGTALPAWTAWLGPAPHVHLAEAPCADYAEFELTHRPEWVEALHGLHAHAGFFADGVSVSALHAFATAAGTPALEAALQCCRLLRRAERYRDALARRGLAFARDRAEADALMHEVEPGLAAEPGPDELPGRFSALLALARRRCARGGVAAFDFESTLTMAATLERLRATSAWPWSARDNETFGPYVSSSPDPNVVLRLYDLDGYDSNGPTYTLEAEIRGTWPGTRHEVVALLMELLAALGARNVAAGSFHGR